MAEIRSAPMPVGFGLIFVDEGRSGGNVIQVLNPRFAWPIPLDDAEPPMQLLIISPEIAEGFIAELKAVNVPAMGEQWFRFGIWEEHEQHTRH
jgi:hypothetical protein